MTWPSSGGWVYSEAEACPLGPGLTLAGCPGISAPSRPPSRSPVTHFHLLVRPQAHAPRDDLPALWRGALAWNSLPLHAVSAWKSCTVCANMPSLVKASLTKEASLDNSFLIQSPQQLSHGYQCWQFNSVLLSFVCMLPLPTPLCSHFLSPGSSHSCQSDQWPLMNWCWLICMELWPRLCSWCVCSKHSHRAGVTVKLDPADGVLLMYLLVV